jgi:protease-4
MVPNVGRALSDKLGIQVETINTSASSDWLGGMRPMTVSEYDIMQQSVDRFYDTFVRRVADGRHLGVKYVDRLAQGRVWTGRDAYGKGLVDTLGGLDLAVRMAADQAKLSKYTVMERPHMESLITRMLSSLSGAKAAKQPVTALLSPYYEVEKVLRGHAGVQAMLPYRIMIQ